MSMLPGKLRAEHARERWADDWYVEPESCVRSLFDTVTFEGAIHDPCCGGGTIPEVAMDCGYLATAADIVDRGYRFGIVRDFFRDETRYDNIISNPPYREAEQIFARASTLSQHKIAFILRLPFLAGQRRRDHLFSIYRPREIVILSKRPSMPPGGTDIPAKGGTTDYCWIIWDRTYSGETILRWA